MAKFRAFTLVELLIVMGVIGILAALLLPAAARARESANRTACLSNLRQLGFAFRMYLNDNNGAFPNAANGVSEPEDWIYWQPGRNPDDGRLMQYVGRKFNPNIYTCPSDDVTTHGETFPYRFSYTMNARIGGAHMNPTTYYPQFHPMRLTQIRNPSEKILIIDESSAGIDDGAWAVFVLKVSSGRIHNILSNRHDRRAEVIGDPSAGKGNVIFADCHGDFVERKWCLMDKYSDPRVP